MKPAKFISVSANHKKLNEFKAEATRLKCSINDEIDSGRGWSWETPENRRIVVFSYHDDLWAYILSVEPPLEDRPKEKRTKSSLTYPNVEEMLLYAYDEPGKKK